MGTKCLHTALFLCLSLTVWSQHTPIVSQYMQNALPLNPAFTGSRDALSIAASYRTQWVGLDGAPTTQTVSVHTPLPNESFAVGLLLFNDQIGVSRQTGAYANFAYRLKLQKGKLQFGLAAGASQRASNWTDINTDQPGDEAFASDQRSEILPNFSFGVYYYNEKWYASLSAPMFLTHKFGGKGYMVENDFENYNLHLNSGFRVELNQDWEMRPSFMVRYTNAAPIQGDLNFLFQYDELVEAGFSYRTDKSVVALARYNVNRQFAIAYSFDWSFNDIAQYHSGTHEITLSYDFKYISNSHNPKFF